MDFSSWKNLLKYTNHIINNNIRDKDEFYTSVVIKEMIKDDIPFENLNINKKIDMFRHAYSTSTILS